MGLGLSWGGTKKNTPLVGDVLEYGDFYGSALDGGGGR